MELGAARWWGAAALVVVALGCGGCSRPFLGELDPPPGEQIVGSVRIDGASQLSQSDILDVIQTHSDNASITGAKPVVDFGEVSDDARRIEAFYASRGFFEARVHDFRVVERSPGIVRVTFYVREGLPTRVRRVRVHGLLDPDAADDVEAAERLADVHDRLDSLLKVERGDVWTEKAYIASHVALKRALLDRGFAFAEVAGQTRVSRKDREAEVRLVVVPGPLARVSTVIIAGEREVSEERILRRVDVETGDILSVDVLDDTERNVFGLSAFYSTKAEVVGPPRDALVGEERSVERLMERARDLPRDVALRVDVQERPEMDGQAGVGAAVENKRGEVYAVGAFGHRNLFGGLQRLALEARPAAVFLPNLFDFTQVAPGAKVSAKFRQPSFLEEYIELGLDTEYELGVEFGYRFHQVNGRVSLARPVWNRLVAEIGYGLGYTAFFEYSGALDLPITSTLGLEFRSSYLVTEMFQNLVFDARDNPLNARRGFYAAANVAQSLRALGSDFHYIRFSADARLYYTFFDRLTLAGRLKFGQVFNVFGGEVPLSGRFRGGGPSDMRGFNSGRMGPFVCQNHDGTQLVSNDDDACSGSKVFIGGKILFLGAVEARYLLFDAFSLALFMDTGEIWSTPKSVELKGINIAVGPGARYITPFGPIRVDLGFLVSEGPKPPWVFHISIGQAF